MVQNKKIKTENENSDESDAVRYSLPSQKAVKNIFRNLCKKKE